ncbi:unnamed protein product, partial [Meganyctiphanes norvegica]
MNVEEDDMIPNVEDDMIPTQMFSKSPIRMVEDENDCPIQVFQVSPRSIADQEDMDPTQVFTNSPRRTGNLGEDLIPTQVFSRNLSKEDVDIEDVPTQVFPKSPGKDVIRFDKKNDMPTQSKEIEDIEDEDIPTQVFPKSPSKDFKAHDDKKNATSQSKENEDNPTQPFLKSPWKDMRNPSKESDDIEDIPTQVFPKSPIIDVNDEEEMPTQVFSKSNLDTIAKNNEDIECTQEFDATQDIGIDIPVCVAQPVLLSTKEINNKKITSSQQDMKNINLDNDDDDDKMSDASETLLADQEELVSQTKDDAQETKEIPSKKEREAEHYKSDESTDIEEFEVIPEMESKSNEKNLVDSTQKLKNKTATFSEGNKKGNLNKLSPKQGTTKIDLKVDEKKCDSSPDKANKSNISRLEISNDSDITPSFKGNETTNISRLELSADSDLQDSEDKCTGSNKTLQVADSSADITVSKKTHTPNFLRIIKPIDNIPSTVSSLNDFVQSSESTQGSVACLGDISLSNIVFADSEDVAEDVTTQDMLDSEPVYKDKSFGENHLNTPQKKSLLSSEDTDGDSDNDQLSSSLRLFDIPPEEVVESPRKSPMQAVTQQKSPRKSASQQKSPSKSAIPKKKSKESENSSSEDEESDGKITIASPVRRKSRRERNNARGGKSSKSTDEEVEIEHKVTGKNVTRRVKPSKSEAKPSLEDGDVGHSSKNIDDNFNKDDALQSKKGRSGAKKDVKENFKSKTNQLKDKKNTSKQKTEGESDETDKSILVGKNSKDIALKKEKGKKSLNKSKNDDDDKSSDIKTAGKVSTKADFPSKTSPKKENKSKSPVKKTAAVTAEKHTRGKRKKKIFDSDSDESDLSDYKGSSNKKRRSNLETPKKDVNKGRNKEIEKEKASSGSSKTNKRKSIELELSDDEAPNKNLKTNSNRSDQSQNESCVTLDDINKPPARRGRRRISEVSNTSSISSSNQRVSVCSRKSTGLMQKPPVRGRGRPSAVHDSESSTAEVSNKGQGRKSAVHDSKGGKAEVSKKGQVKQDSESSTSEVSKKGKGRTSAVHDSDDSAVELPKRGHARKSVLHESDSSVSEVSKRGRGRQSYIQDSDSNIAEVPKKGLGRPSAVHESGSITTEAPKKGRGRQSNIHEGGSKRGNNRPLASQEIDSTVSDSDTPSIAEADQPRRGSRAHREPQKYSPSKNDSKVTKKDVRKSGRRSEYVENIPTSPVQKSKDTLEIKELVKSSLESTEPKKSRGKASLGPLEKKSEKSNKRNSLPVSPDSEENSSKSRKKITKSQELETVGSEKKSGKNTQQVKAMSATSVEKKSEKRPKKDMSATSDGSLKCSSSQSSIDSQASQNKRKRGRNTEIFSTPKSRASGSSKGSPYSGDSVLWSPSHRQQLADTRPKVMFTGFSEIKYEKIISELGGSMVENAQECTVLVADGIKRTVKLMAVLGRGRPIVSSEWLNASKLARNFTDPWSYLVVHKEAEKKWNFQLKKTLKSASSNPLFEGYSLYVTKSVKPPPDQMKEIILCSGGEFLESAPKSAHDKVLVVSCEDDKRQWGTFKKKNIPIVSFEFVLTGLLRHKILIEEYKL